MSDQQRLADTEAKAPDRSLGELVAQLGDDLSGLLSTQVEIAKVEIKDEATKAAKGSGMLVGAALVALVAAVLLSVALAWGLAEFLDPWAGFLIVGLIWAVGGVLLGLAGKKHLQAAKGPEKTMAEIQADKALAQSITSD